MPLSKHLNGHTALIIAILTAAVSYGILVGQVRAIDGRLARVEAALLGNALPRHTSVVPPVEAAERTPR